MEIIIVGAGPTGLALAVALRKRGRAPVVIDRLPQGRNTSRAAVIHAGTLEALQPLGVTQTLLQQGLVVPHFRIRDRDRVLASIDFSGLPTQYPFTLMCPQDRTETILLTALQSLGGGVQRPAELLSLVVRDTAVTVSVRHETGPQEMEARYLVGCDGMHSAVRDAAGIAFQGAAYAEDFILADVTMRWPWGRGEVNLFFSKDGLVVVAPLPGDRFRIVATVDNAPEHPETGLFASILQERCGSVQPDSIECMHWASRFHVQHRVASQFRKGKILLAGDAAHVHSPAGGQGMNTGIQDAVSLAGALDEALTTGTDNALDAWAEQRLAVAKDVVALTDRATRLATLSSSAGRSLRNALVGLAGHVPWVQQRIAERLSELDYRPPPA